MKLILIILSILSLVQAENLQKPEKSETCKTKACEKPDPVVTNDQDSKKNNIAPCGACNTLVKSFQFQVAKSDSSDFESVKRKTCSDVPRSPLQCKENLKKWTQHLEKWFQESNQTRQGNLSRSIDNKTVRRWGITIFYLNTYVFFSVTHSL